MFSRLPMYQRIGPAAYKANLDNTWALSKYLGHPENRFKSIHIAGTNGKGSVAHMLASVLQQAGYKTGLATSPHLKDFRERIKINGTLIAEQAVVDFIKKHKSFLEKLNPSFFEMAIAMTFDHFAGEEVDVAVIETGLGGRLDSTNIITPELAVITNIGLDHTQFLGDTIGQIAGEKAGIIKKNVPVVIGKYQKETYNVFKQTAESLNAPLVIADKLCKLERTAFREHNGKQCLQIDVSWRNNETDTYFTDLLGIYQGENLLCALTALRKLQEGQKLFFTDKDVREGLFNVVGNTGLQGRWQKISDFPPVICDTGHNPSGIQYILEQIKITPHDKLHIVLGMVDDKDRSAVLALLPRKARYYFCKPQVPRGLDQKKLAMEASNYNLNGDHYMSVQDALQAAKKKALTTDLIFIGGSTFVVAEAL